MKNKDKEFRFWTYWIITYFAIPVVIFLIFLIIGGVISFIKFDMTFMFSSFKKNT